MTGTTISHFRVLEKIGAGGMGEVYLAEDTKLDRQVALKVLPPYALASEDDRARFYREARAAAALNHANIGHVYEIDEAMLESGETRPFIAMEYVDGDSLAERITRGPLTLSDVIAIGSQIASGLAAAHAKDIVHRDIKPGNVMLTKAGEAKILDFGLAKTAASTKLTRMGSTLGTFAYMSPEQARGEEVDARTDIWSLGTVLYEMITGRVPFPGEYEQAVVYGILNEEPEPPTGLRTGVPMELERIALKCLSKDRRQRYQHVDEVGVDLGALQGYVFSRSSSIRREPVHYEATQTRSRTSAGLIPVLFAVCGAVLLAVGWMLGRTGGERHTSSTMYYTVLLDPGQQFDFVRPSLTITRDGSMIAYSVDDSAGNRQIYIRRFSEREARRLPGSEGGRSPFFSPEGDAIGYTAGDRLRVFSFETEKSQEMAIRGRPAFDGASWGTDGAIVFTNMGRVEKITPGDVESSQMADPEFDAYVPQYLPEAGALVLSDWDFGQRTGKVVWVSLTNGESHQVLEDAGDARIAGGRIWFIRRSSLFSAPFDAKKGTVTGSPELVVEQVHGSYRGHYLYAVSDVGSVVFVERHTEGNTGVWVDRSGNDSAAQGIEPGWSLHYPEVSPSGRRVAYMKTTANGMNLWVYDANLGREEQLTFGTSDIDGGVPVWSADGSEIIYHTLAEGKPVTRRKSIMHLRPDRDIPRVGWYMAHAPVTERVVLYDNQGIHYYSFADDTTVTFRRTENNQARGASLSPDEKWMVYASDESGEDRIYISDFPDGTVTKRISVGRGTEPQWSPVGDELFYRDGNWLVSVPFESAQGTVLSEPEYLFSGPYIPSPLPKPYYDVDADGHTFFMIAREGGPKRLAVNLIQNAVM